MRNDLPITYWNGGYHYNKVVYKDAYHTVARASSKQELFDKIAKFDYKNFLAKVEAGIAKKKEPLTNLNRLLTQFDEFTNLINN